MKYKLLLFAFFAITACSENNDAQQVCTNKLWNLQSACNPANLTDCVYFATFGETQSNTGTIGVTEATFEHYSALGDPTNGSVCWDGMHD